MSDDSRHSGTSDPANVRPVNGHATGSPVLSVVVPVHGRSELAVVAVRSILEQSIAGLEIEVIVVDDGTPDAADVVFDRAADRRVRVLRHDHRRGAAAARNTGVEGARADLVAFLDSDDRWLDGMATAQLRVMASVAAPVVGVTTAYFLDQGAGHYERRSPQRNGDLLPGATRGCPLAPGTTLAIRRSAWLEIGGLDETLERLEDWDFMLRLAQRGMTLAFYPEALASVRWSVPGPPPDVVARSCAKILSKHEAWVRGRSLRLSRQLRATAAYEVGLAALRHRRYGEAVPLLARSVFLDPSVRLLPAARSVRRRVEGRRTSEQPPPPLPRA